MKTLKVMLVLALIAVGLAGTAKAAQTCCASADCCASCSGCK